MSNIEVNAETNSQDKSTKFDLHVSKCTPTTAQKSSAQKTDEMTPQKDAMPTALPDLGEMTNSKLRELNKNMSKRVNQSLAQRTLGCYRTVDKEKKKEVPKERKDSLPKKEVRERKSKGREKEKNQVYWDRFRLKEGQEEEEKGEEKEDQGKEEEKEGEEEKEKPVPKHVTIQAPSPKASKSSLTLHIQAKASSQDSFAIAISELQASKETSITSECPVQSEQYPEADLDEAMLNQQEQHLTDPSCSQDL